MRAPLLTVDDLAVSFPTDEGLVRAVDGVSFSVGRGQTLGIVGESGCGKSVTSLAIMGLLPAPGRVDRGRIVFEGQDLVGMSEPSLRALRGRRVAMVFQDPSSALHPVYTVGAQIDETLRAHLPLSRAAARARTLELLARVGVPAPAERADAFPHQLSGGMRQRVMIAMALACEPTLLIADEPTTALDVTIQAQILDLLSRLAKESDASVVLITHDLGVVAEFADDVAVMYAGRIVEHAPAAQLFARPRHPYTRGLLRSAPSHGDNARSVRLPTIRGVVPDLRSLPAGCSFQARCDEATDACRGAAPPLVSVDADHLAACVHARPGALSAEGGRA